VEKRVTWPVVLVAVAGVAVTIVSVYLLSTWPPEPPQPQNATAQTATVLTPDPEPAPTGDRTPPSPSVSGATDQATLLAVLGDGFTAASDVSSGPEWPVLVGEELGWEITVDAVDDTGFLHDGGGRPLPGRLTDLLQRSPDVILVAGGESDLGRHPVEDVAAEADTLVSRLVQEAAGADVVLASPFSHGAPGPLTRELTRELRAVADEHGVRYVDVSEWLRQGGALFGEDPDHPVDAGQQIIAEQMAAELDRLGVS
jgi:lysophospholipase L1-like esterase